MEELVVPPACGGAEAHRSDGGVKDKEPGEEAEEDEESLALLYGDDEERSESHAESAGEGTRVGLDDGDENDSNGVL